MKRSVNSVFFTVILLAGSVFPVAATELLVPGGTLVGLELSNDTVTVAAFDDALGSDARRSGLRIGDEILSIDGTEVDTIEDVRKALTACDTDVELQLRRGESRHTLRINPRATEDGPRLGVYLKQGVAGIGTVTFYDPETHRFGTLGHAVSDGGGKILAMTEGRAFPAQVASVKKGISGQPGQLRGTADAVQTVGTLIKNTPQGVFGTSPTGWPGEPLPVADYDEIRTGAATIRSTVQGDRVQEYSVEILKIYPEDRADHRNFLIKVTDPSLLEATGGIVQGMSGSPIIQDGKLIGAVTHVLVNDPTTGYGIFIENMLDAAA